MPDNRPRKPRRVSVVESKLLPYGKREYSAAVRFPRFVPQLLSARSLSDALPRSIPLEAPIREDAPSHIDFSKVAAAWPGPADSHPYAGTRSDYRTYPLCDGAAALLSLYDDVGERARHVLVIATRGDHSELLDDIYKRFGYALKQPQDHLYEWLPAGGPRPTIGPPSRRYLREWGGRA